MRADPPPVASVRRREGRWLAGVCSGLAARWGVSVVRLRIAFVLGALVMLLGVVVYLAFLLILPAEGAARRTRALRAATAVAQGLAAVLGLATLTVVGGGLALVGSGAVVVGAAALLIVAGAWRGRLRLPARLLLPVAALTVPATVVVLAGLSMAPNVRDTRLRPVALRAGQMLQARSGLGGLEIDLRRTRLPASGVVRLRVSAGTARTVVALPHGRCVGVVIDRRRPPAAWRSVLSVLAPRGDHDETRLFGRDRSGVGRRVLRTARRPALTVAIDFVSVSGPLTVRDYQDEVDPLRQPGWPGEAGLTPRPSTEGFSRAEAADAVRYWRAVRASEEQSAAQVRPLIAGPCGERSGARR